MKRIKIIMPLVAILFAVVATFAAHEPSKKDAFAILPQYDDPDLDCSSCSSTNIIPTGSTCTYIVTPTLCKCRVGGVDRQLYGIGDGVTVDCFQPLYKQ